MLKMMYQKNKAAGDGSTRPPLTTTSNERDLHVMAVTQLALFSDESQEKEVVYRQGSLFGKTDLNIGLKFGKLTVVEFVKKDRWRKKVYKCRCECGKAKNARLDNLQAGKLTSCGCNMVAGGDSRKNSGQSLMHDLTGQVFGDLTVLGENGKNGKGEYFWLCRCSCGGSKSVMGRLLRNGIAKTHCGCKNPTPKPKSAKTKKKQKDHEAFAKDIWCGWINEGFSVREAGREIGFSGNRITNLLMEYIPGYREASEIRREKSEWSRLMRQRKKKSKLFRLEKDLQEHCAKALRERGEVIFENDRETTGFEIDIATLEYCYELKVTTLKKDIYGAMGQLAINSNLSGLKPALVIPSDTTMSKGMYQILEEQGIEVYNETNI